MLGCPVLDLKVAISLGLVLISGRFFFVVFSVLVGMGMFYVVVFWFGGCSVSELIFSFMLFGGHCMSLHQIENCNMR